MKAPFVEFFKVGTMSPEESMKDFFSKHPQFKLISHEHIDGGIRAYYKVVKE